MYKPTVLIANGIMNAGGTETLIMELLRHKSNRVNYILLIHYQKKIQKGIYDDEIRSLGVKIIYIPSVGSVGISAYCEKFKEIVSSLGKVDIVHSHLNANGGIICMAAKQCGILNRICHCHADIRFRGTFVQKLKEECSLQVLRLFVNRFSNNYWACSLAAWKRLFYPWKEKILIPNMIDVQKYLMSPKEVEDAKNKLGLSGKLILGSVGRVARIKNYEHIIKVLAQLVKLNVDAHFVCYGRFDALNDRYCSELLALATQLGVVSRIHFEGNSMNISDDIKSFDILLMPSITEGFGMAAIEAQAAGIPVILSDGVPRMVDVELGLAQFLPINDISVWVNHILKQKTRKFISSEVILEHFRRKGYDSRENVNVIEERYIKMLHN